MANLDNLLADATARIEQGVKNEIDSYKRSVKTVRSTAKKRIKMELPKRVETIKALVALGVMDSDSEKLVRYATCKYTWDDYNRLNVTSKIGVLRTMYGSDFVALDEESKEEHDASANEVRVYLKHQQGWKGPRLYVVVTLDDSSKCKFKTITRTETTLVCDND